MLRRFGQFMLLVAMVSIIALGCIQATTVQGEDDLEPEKDTTTITLYFIDAELAGLIPEERCVTVQEKNMLPAIIVEETLRGPEGPDLTNPVPEGTRLLSLEIEKGKATLNLSGEIRDNFNAGAMGEGFIIYSFVNALTEISYIEEVMFLVDGKVIESIGGHFLLEEPFTRDESLIISKDS
jgi:germination protein M